MARFFSRPPTARGGLALCAATALITTLALGSCDGGDPDPRAPHGDAELAAMEYGRLVDLYGLRRSARGEAIELHQRDVLTAPDAVVANRASGGTGLYEFLRPDPQTLQPRLLIRAEIGSAGFDSAVLALDRGAGQIAPAVCGQDTTMLPFSVVARNAAIRLTFSRPLGIDNDFFVATDEHGNVTGLENNEAVQLLEIAGDPNDAKPQGDFRPIEARIIVRGAQIILDPVLLGTEGATWGRKNSATGLPESPDQRTANIRLALALDGPLRIVGLREDDAAGFTGDNGTGRRSIIRDFRSGNRADDTPRMARGFLRDTSPLRLVGEIVTYLEKVEPWDAGQQVITVFKNGKTHEIDAGDGIRIVGDAGPALSTEVIVDPKDDRGAPEVQHVRVVVPSVAGLEEIDPSRDPGYPQDPRAREAWLVEHAPRVVIAAEFTASRRVDGRVYGDDPRYFVTFEPEPLPLGTEEVPPNENVSPFASVLVRFSKPVDRDTVRGLDSLFIATRDVLSPDAIEQFRSSRRISASRFNYQKFVTPHLVYGRVFDADGSQTTFRLEPPLGMYLDERMRHEDNGVPFERQRFRYFLHLDGSPRGIKDLSGNTLDFADEAGPGDRLVLPFSLDTRRQPDGSPTFADNLVASVARRFEDEDEDERPSYHRAEEYADDGDPRAFKSDDLFGAVLYIDGRMLARGTARATRIVDNQNQIPAPPQGGPFAWYPSTIRDPDGLWGFEGSQATPTGAIAFGSPIQTPLNPFGSRLQTVWREIDMSLSRIDAFDFNLDVEQMHWAPFQADTVLYDEFDRMSLYLGHSERRPEPAVGTFSSLAVLRESGLDQVFADNYLRNPGLDGLRESGADPHPAFVDRRLVIDPTRAVTDPTGTNSFLPLPAFDEPYFVWRDERVMEQGASARYSRDTAPGVPTRDFDPYLLSPFLGGRGTDLSVVNGSLVLALNTWNNLGNFNISNWRFGDRFTDGGVGSIALPLLADFRVFPDDPDSPLGRPFRAAGVNGWQVSLTVQSAPFPSRPQYSPPFFRAYSSGYRPGAGAPVRVEPGRGSWTTASGGWDPIAQQATIWGDNATYWIMADFLKRRSVATAGFVEFMNPHRMPDGVDGLDPRLGPFDEAVPRGYVPQISYDLEPPTTGGAQTVVEFRAADAVDPQAWRALLEGWVMPDKDNFPGDPRKAGDAHIRKYDDRSFSWTYPYNGHVTDYTAEPNELLSRSFLERFGRDLTARDMKYFNWRFLFVNSEATAPQVESFAVSWRFQPPGR